MVNILLRMASSSPAHCELPCVLDAPCRVPRAAGDAADAADGVRAAPWRTGAGLPPHAGCEQSAEAQCSRGSAEGGGEGR